MWPLPLDLKIPPSAYSNRIKVSVSAFAYALESRQICDKNETSINLCSKDSTGWVLISVAWLSKMETDNQPLSTWFSNMYNLSSQKIYETVK